MHLDGEVDRSMNEAFSAAWQQRLAVGDRTLHIHLLGIGGAGLHPIAKVLHEQGIQVSGSDVVLTDRTRELDALGMTIFSRQVEANLTDHLEHQPDVVLTSSAVGHDNAERQAAERMGLPVVTRRNFLGPLLARRKVIAIAGSHGKSTTTAMIVQIMQHNRVDAGYIVGSSLPEYGNARTGTDPYFVIEADEYDHMFLGLSPVVAVVTNVDWDHPDCYPTRESFHQAFRQFVNKIRPGGTLITCRDDQSATAIARDRADGNRWIDYGLSPAASDKRTGGATMQAVDARPGSNGGYEADIVWKNRLLGHLSLRVPGLHNLYNSLAALTVAGRCGLNLEESLHALASYRGIVRRFEDKGLANGVTVVDDYAHHPTEVRATLAAARDRFRDRRIWAVFQPHTFSRTGSMLLEMATSFSDADRVIVTDIYAARETDDGTITSADLVASSDHRQMVHITGMVNIVDYLLEEVAPGDVVLTLGAGTSNQIGEQLLQKLAKSNGR